MNKFNTAISFKKHLEPFKTKVLDVHQKKTEDARRIMNDPNYQWRDDKQKNAARGQLESYEAWLKYYQNFYDSLDKACKQHEALINDMSDMYQKWYDVVSNEGLQERELMSEQADTLNEIFSKMYQILKVLNPNLKAPSALNLK